MKNTLVLLLFLPGSCLAADPWSRQDIIRQSMFLGLQTIDFLQTRYITTHDDYVESNLILGREPNLQQVARYNLAVMAGNTLIAHLLPASTRRNWQYLTIGIELQSVVHNAALGVQLEF